MARITTVAKARKDQGTCEGCHQPIVRGESYRWVQPKTSAYGGRRRVRHSRCGTWQPWDLTGALWAQIARVAHDAQESFDSSSPETPEDVSQILSDAADEIRNLAEERREKAENIRDGFGHDTYMSEQLDDEAEQLDSWADDIEGADVPDLPEPEESDCEQCNGTGHVDCEQCEGTGEVAVDDVEAEADPTGERRSECDECNGTGEIDCDECDGRGLVEPEDGNPTDEQMDAWRDEARDALSVLDDNPL